MHFLFALLFLSVALPLGFCYFGSRRKPQNGAKTGEGRARSMIFVNIVSFFGILVFATVFMFGGYADAASVPAGADDVRGMAFLAAALVTGLCTIGTGIAVGQAASAALGALSENEKIMGKALIFVSLAEGIAIYGLLISFTILGRV